MISSTSASIGGGFAALDGSQMGSQRKIPPAQANDSEGLLTGANRHADIIQGSERRTIGSCSGSGPIDEPSRWRRGTDLGVAGRDGKRYSVQWRALVDGNKALICGPFRQ